MSLELNKESNDKENKVFINKEHKWKELLYELFYEIKSEIFGTKIEIDEEEYQQNIKAIDIPKLVKYIHDSILILVQKKIEDTINGQKEMNFFINNNKNDSKLISNDNNYQSQYESILKKLEVKERYLTKLNFQNKLQKDAMEHKISEYMDLEEEFEAMKAKLKYEDGRFLNNDRKENEVIIIRGENSNLKKTINNLESQISNLNKEISEKNQLISKSESDIKKLKEQLEELKKQNDILNNHSINININNVTGPNNKNNIKDSINRQIPGKYYENYISEINACHLKEKINQYFPYQKIKNKMHNNKKYPKDTLNNTRNESSEKIKSDILSKYLTGNRITNNKIPINNSCVKVNYYPIGNKEKINNNFYRKYFFRNINNNSIKKKGNSGGNNSSRSVGNKGKGKIIMNNNNDLNYQSL